MDGCSESLTSATGRSYTLEIRSFYDDKRDKNLRVRLSIDDGGWSAIVPMSSDFIVAPDGSFVGE